VLHDNLIAFICTAGMVMQDDLDDYLQAIAAQPATQDALARLLLHTALPHLAVEMEAAAAADSGSRLSKAKEQHMETASSLTGRLGTMLKLLSSLPAGQRPLSAHSNPAALRCAARVLNALPLHRAHSAAPESYREALVWAITIAGALVEARTPAGAGGSGQAPAAQSPQAWELVRLLPRIAALVHNAAADAELRSVIGRLATSMDALVNGMPPLTALGGRQPVVATAAEVVEWAEAIDASLGLLSLLLQWNSSRADPPPQQQDKLPYPAAVVVRFGYLLTGMKASLLAWIACNSQQAAQAAAHGAFHTLARIHARACRLLCWVAPRKRQVMVPGAGGCLHNLQLPSTGLACALHSLHLFASSVGEIGHENRWNIASVCGATSLPTRMPAVLPLQACRVSCFLGRRTPALPLLKRSSWPHAQTCRRGIMRAAVAAHVAALQGWGGAATALPAQPGQGAMDPTGMGDANESETLLGGVAAYFPRLFQTVPLLTAQLEMLKPARLLKRGEVRRRHLPLEGLASSPGHAPPLSTTVWGPLQGPCVGSTLGGVCTAAMPVNSRL
jgi:hypothetical protein